MHAKYQRHIQHANRGLVINVNNPDGGTVDGHDQGGGFTLTGPLTITVRTTLGASATPATPTSSSSSAKVATSISTPTLVQTSSSQIVSPSSTSSTPTSSTSTSSTSFTLFPSVLPPSSTPSNLPTGNNATPEGSNALLNSSLPSGAIAGIVIGCLVLLFLGLFFGMRQRFQRNRLRLRGMWTRNSNIGQPTLLPESSYGPKYYPDMTYTGSGAPQVTNPTSPAPEFSPAVARKISVRVPPPPMSYNSNEGTSSPYAGLSAPPATISNQFPDGGGGGGGSGSTGALNAAVYSQGSANLSPFGAAVVCTFITSLPDELSINVGETIRVLAEYDDGWALCMNTSGQQGMVPMECLNRGGGAAPSTMNLSPPRLPDARGVRRTSSLDPTQALKARRS